MPTKIKLTYFNIEGVAEPIRLALALAGQDFEDDRVAFPDWAALKPKTPYGQLPLLTVDDGPVRTQAMAILRWVGATCSETLYPRDKLLDIEEALGVVEDLKQSWTPRMYMGMRPETYGYPKDFSKTDEGKALVKSVREQWVKEDLPTHLDRITGLLEKSGGKFLVAGTTEPTIADCLAVTFLRGFTKGHVDFVDTKCLETHPKVVAYCKNFLDLPAIKGRYQDGLGSASY